MPGGQELAELSQSVRVGRAVEAVLEQGADESVGRSAAAVGEVFGRSDQDRRNLLSTAAGGQNAHGARHPGGIGGAVQIGLEQGLDLGGPVLGGGQNRVGDGKPAGARRQQAVPIGQARGIDRTAEQVVIQLGDESLVGRSALPSGSNDSCTVSVLAFDVPPPGAGFATVTPSAPSSGSKLAGTTAVN